MSILFCVLCVNTPKIKILKEVDRQAFTKRFSTKQGCYEFLAELKGADDYSCKRCKKVSNLPVAIVINVVMMSPLLQGLYFISSSLILIKFLGCSMRLQQARKEQTVFGFHNVLA